MQKRVVALNERDSEWFELLLTIECRWSTLHRHFSSILVCPSYF